MKKFADLIADRGERGPEYRVLRSMNAFGHELHEGQLLYRFTGATHGCISNAGVACAEGPQHNPKLPGYSPFFEVPLDALEAL